MSHAPSHATPDGAVDADIEFLTPDVEQPFSYGGVPAAH